MATQNIIEIENIQLAPGERLIGLDLGTRTIGIALSDSARMIATGLETLKRKSFGADSARLIDLAQTHNVAAFVIGMPLNMDGSAGPRVQATHAFIRNMAAKTPLPFITWDERLSTVAAERALLDSDTSRAKRARVVDKVAAAFILQGALDRLAVINVVP